MRRPLRFLLLGAVVAVSAAASAPAYLLAYFTRGGQSGLHLAWSADGFAWEALNGGRPVLPARVGGRDLLLRDPSVARGPDGTYHVVWTTGWWERAIGYASTRDFVTWSEPRELPVMAHEPGTRNTWAPEVAWDEASGVFVIFWASTVHGRWPESGDGTSEDGLNHRLYATTTKDFLSFTPTALFLDPGFNVIDATFLVADGRRWLVVKDETKFPVPAKHLRLAPAEGVSGPFGTFGAPVSPAGLWVEGPSAVVIGGDRLIYYDAYTEKRFGVLRSRDGRSWEDVSSRLRLPGEGTPDRARHGTVLAVPRELIEGLRRTEPATP
jgi:hypothetical protein